MNLYRDIKNYLQRRHRTKVVTRAAQTYARQLFPGMTPDWCLIAEEHPRECVVYQTYRPTGSPTTLLLHRFFRVKLDDLTVTSLEAGYWPEKWGPFL